MPSSSTDHRPQTTDPSFVVLWTWPDGWRLVRPTDKHSFWRLYGRLCTEASFQPGDEGEELRFNEEGRASNVFFLRPVKAPVGARMADSDRVAGQIFFARDTRTGKLLPRMNPGRYRPLVLDLLRHAYDVFLALDNVIEGVFTDRDEELFLPTFGTFLGKPHLDHFVSDVALEVAGSSVSGFRSNWGWTPLQVAENSPPGMTQKSFDKPFSEVSSTHREQHRKGRYFLQVSVPAFEGEFAVEGGMAFDLRPHLRSVVPDLVGSKGSDSAYVRRMAWPRPVPPDAPRLPWTVRLPTWGEEISDADLEQALSQLGVVARTEHDVRQTAERRSVRGSWHPSFEIPILLAEVPDLLIAPLDRLKGLETDYGTCGT